VDVPQRLPACASVGRGEDGIFGWHPGTTTTGGTKWKEETVKTLRPSVWLTEDFSLSIDEFLPLLDILASLVRAVRRLHELLTTKFPPGTFPVKVTQLTCSIRNHKIAYISSFPDSVADELCNHTSFLVNELFQSVLVMVNHQLK
jgi:hypothetical protein